MSKITKIERELHQAVDPFEIREGERRQVYLLRLVKAVDQLNDNEFSALSRDAQMWQERAAQAVVKNKIITDFEPDDEEVDEAPRTSRRRLAGAPQEEPEDQDTEWEDAEPEPEQEQPRRKKKAVEQEEEPAPRAKRASKPELEPETQPVKRKDKSNGATPKAKPISRRGLLPTGRNKHIQDKLADDPNATIDEIIEYLLAQGTPESEIPSRISISTTRSSFRSALETMDRKKMLKKRANLERIVDPKED